jgi:uncharacterized protein (TIGR00369 family)
MNAPTTAEQTLALWQAEERAIRDTIGDAGVIDAAAAQAMSGLEVFEAMLAGRAPSAPIAHVLDFLPVVVERGRVVFQGRPRREFYNPMGTVHGGWYATLLDSAVGCAVHTTLPPGKGYTTLELKLNIVRALTDRVPLVRAEGVVVHAGNQVATAEGRLVGPDGRLYAHASTTCLVFDARVPAR